MRPTQHRVHRVRVRRERPEKYGVPVPKEGRGEAGRGERSCVGYSRTAGTWNAISAPFDSISPRRKRGKGGRLERENTRRTRLREDSMLANGRRLSLLSPPPPSLSEYLFRHLVTARVDIKSGTDSDRNNNNNNNNMNFYRSFVCVCGVRERASSDRSSAPRYYGHIRLYVSEARNRVKIFSLILFKCISNN